jgi:hypothetical protein
MRLVRGVNQRQLLFVHARLNTNFLGSRPGTRGTSLIKRAEPVEKKSRGPAWFKPVLLLETSCPFLFPPHLTGPAGNERFACAASSPLGLVSPLPGRFPAARIAHLVGATMVSSPPFESPVRVRAMAIGEPASYACLC